MTTALITGIGGFVGSHLAEYLLENTDWDIVGALRWQEPLDNLSGITEHIGGRIKLVDMDLRDSHSVNNAIKVRSYHYIFHLAAQSYPKSSYDSPNESFETNSIGTLNLLEAVRQWCPSAWVHNCSSSEVYGNPDRTPIDESTPFNPLSPYAISKASADMIGRYYANAYGLSVITTRMFTHTGPRRGDVFAESSFAKQIAMIEAGLMDGPIKVGNLDSLRTIADVRDAVRAYHMLLTVNPTPGEAYNIGGNYVCMVSEILKTLCELAHMSYLYEVDKDRLRPLDATNQVPNCSKFTSNTGWKPVIPFEQTMSDLLEYWRDRVKRSVVINR